MVFATDKHLFYLLKLALCPEIIPADFRPEFRSNSGIPPFKGGSGLRRMGKSKFCLVFVFRCELKRSLRIERPDHPVALNEASGLGGYHFQLQVAEALAANVVV
jgi:hypothetical protein